VQSSTDELRNCSTFSLDSNIFIYLLLRLFSLPYYCYIDFAVLARLSAKFPEGLKGRTLADLEGDAGTPIEKPGLIVANSSFKVKCGNSSFISSSYESPFSFCGALKKEKSRSISNRLGVFIYGEYKSICLIDSVGG
jgi:hypothetical protein